jgi:hypothetical protein
MTRVAEPLRFDPAPGQQHKNNSTYSPAWKMMLFRPRLWLRKIAYYTHKKIMGV